MWSHQHDGFTVYQLPALRDNYIYLIAPDSLQTLIAIDPAEAPSVRRACQRLGRNLTHVFNTHHHWDHTDGNLPLKQSFGARIAGAEEDADRIPGIDLAVSESAPPELPGLDIRVLSLPGHTHGHIAYLIGDALFCGDTLFGAGCGRLFEGSPAEMWQSLKKIAALDGGTRIYCAHEYTLANLAFAAAVDADNEKLAQRMDDDRVLREQGLPTIPSRLDVELATNPFLRPLDASFCHRYAAARGIADDPLSLFTDLRLQKDRW